MSKQEVNKGFEVNLAWQPGLTLADMEKMVIMRAFDYFKSNKTQTAQSLGISIRTLDDRLEKYQKVEGTPMHKIVELRRNIRAAMIHFGDENKAQVCRVVGISLAQLEDHLREISKEASSGKELTKEQTSKSADGQPSGGVPSAAGKPVEPSSQKSA